MRPIKTEGFVRNNGLFPKAMLGELRGDGDIAIRMRLDPGVTCGERQSGADRVVNAGAQEELLPVLSKIRSADLGFEMQSPRPLAERMVADVVEPEVAVGLGVIGSEEATDEG